MTAIDPGIVATASHQHLSPVLGRYFQRTWVRGQGHRLWDADGHQVLDFACGIAVTVLGHGHPRVSAAIHAQVDTLVHVCNGLGYLDPVSRLADAIADATRLASAIGARWKRPLRASRRSSRISKGGRAPAPR